GFLHFELKQNNKDLIYWKNLVEFCYHELEEFALMMIMLVIFIKILFVGAIIMMNTRSVHWYDELTQLEYLRTNKTSDAIALKTFVLAHENMKRSIEKFRKDARKLLSPNEMEITLPIDEVYGVLENEMHYIRRSRFYNMDIAADDNVNKK
ncbi:hypothetical protein DOY81_010431, partial [Sarcophaga bullata]